MINCRAKFTYFLDINTEKALVREILQKYFLYLRAEQ